MPSATKSAAGAATANQHDDLDNYNVGDLSDDPFATPSPQSKNKRKSDDAGLGIDEEVDVQKRGRAPAVKLDEERLLSDAGIPKLRRRAQGLKLKGKGHEVGRYIILLFDEPNMSLVLRYVAPTLLLSALARRPVPQSPIPRRPRHGGEGRAQEAPHRRAQ
ncbi:hypothetical protein NLG97_g7146 [Lecanicillium saksenae]|uniref:Uncharacterized protein n=1 Tax=Lecanicillium saksenae TaxID=468837 RepID=A0ACC1QPB8_9HYPO|nr:hypothetical protein NLG97_g7146 [Lecanicillium saksenae]